MAHSGSKGFYYIDAVTISVAKRILKFYFEHQYVKALKNDETTTYDVYLEKPKDEKELEYLKDDIQYFVDYWGANYKFFWSNKED